MGNRKPAVAAVAVLLVGAAGVAGAVAVDAGAGNGGTRPTTSPTDAQEYYRNERLRPRSQEEIEKQKELMGYADVSTLHVVPGDEADHSTPAAASDLPTAGR